MLLVTARCSLLIGRLCDVRTLSLSDSIWHLYFLYSVVQCSLPKGYEVRLCLGGRGRILDGRTRSLGYRALGSIGRSKPAWDTGDPVSKENKRNRLEGIPKTFSICL